MYVVVVGIVVVDGGNDDVDQFCAHHNQAGGIGGGGCGLLYFEIDINLCRARFVDNTAWRQVQVRRGHSVVQMALACWAVRDLMG